MFNQNLKNSNMLIIAFSFRVQIYRRRFMLDKSSHYFVKKISIYKNINANQT